MSHRPIHFGLRLKLQFKTLPYKFKFQNEAEKCALPTTTTFANRRVGWFETNLTHLGPHLMSVS